MKLLSLILIFCLIVPPPAVALSLAQTQSVPTVEEKMNFVLGVIGKLKEDTDCNNQNQDATKQYFCEVGRANLAFHTTEPNEKFSEATKEKIEFSVLGGEIVGLVLVGISYMLERKSIGKTFLQLTAYEEMILSNEKVFNKYLATPVSARPTMYSKAATLNEIFSKTFTKIESMTSDMIRFSWKSGSQTLSKELATVSFRSLISEMSKVLPKSYTKYLTDIHGVSSATQTAEAVFKKKLFFAEEAAGLAYGEPALRKFSLRLGSWGIVILLASTALDILLTYNKHNNPPTIDVNPENIKEMVMNDPHALKVYILQPYPDVLDYLYNYFKTIPQAVADFESLKTTLGVD